MPINRQDAKEEHRRITVTVQVSENSGTEQLRRQAEAFLQPAYF